MGFVYQTYPIVGGTVLIIERVQSQNYVAGSSGWAIDADGDAEFNNLVARGELIIGNDPGQHIRGGLDGIGRPVFEFYTGGALESDPGYIRSTPPIFPNESALELSSPLNANAPVGSIRPQVLLTSWAGSASLINFFADLILTNTPILLDQFWVNLPFSGTWTDVAGARAGYFKDATGRVQLRGQVVGGAAAQIGVLPAGYRPSQTMEWIMRGAGGVVLCAITVSTTGILTVTANAATAQASGVRLDSISFPAAF